jgi:ferric-dicitrate binding protein FerR (iron transport regulator)
MENSQQPGGRKDIKQAYRTAYLIAGFLKQTLTEDEKRELDAWILASDENMELFEKMTDEKNIEQATDWFKKMNVEDELQETKRRISGRKPFRFLPYAVAAAVIILIVAGIYMYQNNNYKNSTTSLSNEKQDIMPGSDMATLTLDNGQKIILNNKGADTTINSQVKILRKDGQLVYNGNTSANALVYNTLTVPRKGQYKLVLPDGTKVWLNAESSIRYPVAFIGNERKVFVTGETFFEVAKDKSKPFRVVASNITVEALGTQFDINAYSNEPFFAATLVEGLVRISNGAKENILKPGQQAQIANDNLKIVDTNVDEVTAWKNNQFKFSGTSIDEIMRQVERWYDADVEFKDSITLHLNATIERDVPVSKLLHIFEETGQLHFKIEDKKIFVMK